MVGLNWTGTNWALNRSYSYRSLDFAKRKPPMKNSQVVCSGWAHLGLNQGPPDYESGALTN